MATTTADGRRRAVTAFFDERSQAQAAVDDLLAAGVDRGRITLIEGGPGMKTDPVEPSSEKGFLAAVRELFMADEDHHAYGEGLRRGGFLLSVETGAGDHARIVEVLDREGAIDMDARQSDWELEGWDPARASADLRAMSEEKVRAAVEPVGAIGPAFGLGTAAPVFAAGTAPPAMTSLSAEEVRAAVEPVGGVGPAFGAGEARSEPTRRVVRDTDADGLRLRSYVESHDGPDPTR